MGVEGPWAGGERWHLDGEAATYSGGGEGGRGLVVEEQVGKVA